MLLVSDGNSATLKALVSNADPVRVALSVLTPLVPLVLLMFACHLIEEFLVVRGVPVRTCVSAALVALGSCMLLSNGTPLLAFTCFAALFLGVFYERRNFLKTGERVKVFQPFFAVAVVAVAVMASGPWMALERIELEEKPPITGYFLSSQDDWSTLLSMDGEVIIVRSDQVVARTVCDSPAKRHVLLTSLRDASDSRGFDCSSVGSQPDSEPSK
ncbi:hypothetical protein [Rhodococcus aetherivorans]